MGFQFKLPDLGEGVREGEILRWLVAEGDEIIQDQPVIEVMTDKITAELPSPIAGRVEKLLEDAYARWEKLEQTRLDGENN